MKYLKANCHSLQVMHDRIQILEDNRNFINGSSAKGCAGTVMSEGEESSIFRLDNGDYLFSNECEYVGVKNPYPSFYLANMHNKNQENALNLVDRIASDVVKNIRSLELGIGYNDTTELCSVNELPLPFEVIKRIPFLLEQEVYDGGEIWFHAYNPALLEVFEDYGISTTKDGAVDAFKDSLCRLLDDILVDNNKTNDVLLKLFMQYLHVIDQDKYISEVQLQHKELSDLYKSYSTIDHIILPRSATRPVQVQLHCADQVNYFGVSYPAGLVHAEGPDLESVEHFFAEFFTIQYNDLLGNPNLTNDQEKKIQLLSTYY